MEVITLSSTSIDNISDSEFEMICYALDFLHKTKIEEDSKENAYIIELEDMCQKLGMKGYDFS